MAIGTDFGPSWIMSTEVNRRHSATDFNERTSTRMMSMRLES